MEKLLITALRIQSVLIILVGTVLTGCSSEPADVRGQVTNDGEPVPNIIVYFVPQKGPRAEATTDEEGYYRLMTPGKGTGTVVGKHRVCFVPPPSEEEELAKQQLSEEAYLAGNLPKTSQTPPKSIIPRQLMSIHTSQLNRDVQSGSSNFNFELQEL